MIFDLLLPSPIFLEIKSLSPGLRNRGQILRLTSESELWGVLENSGVATVLTSDSTLDLKSL